MNPTFEAAGDISDWPPNVNGKPTQAVVFGLLHPTKGRTCEILWTGKFPDLQPAMYWAAKKETHAVRRDKWMVASRILWQHDLTPEQAVAAAQKQMDPQLDLALGQVAANAPVDIGPGPMHPVDYDKAHGFYIEAAPEDHDGEAPISGFIINEQTDRPQPKHLIGPHNIMPDPRELLPDPPAE